MTINPLADRVVVQYAKPEEKTQGGIILTASTQEKPQVATVTAVGLGKNGEPVSVKVGDQVLVGKYAGTEIKVGDEEYTIVNAGDILAIIE